MYVIADENSIYESICKNQKYELKVVDKKLCLFENDVIIDIKDWFIKEGNVMIYKDGIDYYFTGININSVK